MAKRKGFNRWINQLATTRGWNVNDMLNDPTYNYRTFYNKNRSMAMQMLNENPEAHFTDVGKTAQHPTFSTESVYSGKVSKYNPLGIQGGTWENNGHRYRMSYDQVNNGWDVLNTINYVEQAEPNGVQVVYPRGEYPMINGITWMGVLPEVEIIAPRKRTLEQGGK